MRGLYLIDRLIGYFKLIHDFINFKRSLQYQRLRKTENSAGEQEGPSNSGFLVRVQRFKDYKCGSGWTEIWSIGFSSDRALSSEVWPHLNLFRCTKRYSFIEASTDRAISRDVCRDKAIPSWALNEDRVISTCSHGHSVEWTDNIQTALHDNLDGVFICQMERVCSWTGHNFP